MSILLFDHYDDEGEQKTNQDEQDEINPNNLPMPFVRNSNKDLVLAKPGTKEAGYRFDKKLGKLVKL